MKIEIRRNRTVTLSCEMNCDNNEALKKLLEQASNLTPEQQATFDERERIKKEIEERVWAEIERIKPNDLLGNPITRETHEICYDMDACIDTKGELQGVYIQPKKSEYDKD